MSELEEAVEHCELAQLLRQKEDTSDEQVREQIHRHIELTRAKLNLAENKLNLENEQD